MDRLKRSFTRAVLPVVVAAGVSVASDGAEARSKLTRPSPVPTVSAQKCDSAIRVGRQEAAYVTTFNLNASPENMLDVRCAQNADQKRNWASITKFLALSVVMDSIQGGKLGAEQKIPVTPESLALTNSGFAMNWIPRNMRQISVREAMVHSMHSSNPMLENLATATARAETANANLSHADSQKWFVGRMRERLTDWGMGNTGVMNVTGLPVGDRSGQYSTAHDVGKMLLRLLPYYSDLRSYATAPLTSDGVRQYVQDTATQRAKDEVARLGALGKSGTLNNCSSYAAVNYNKLEMTGSIAVSLCGERPAIDVLANLKALDSLRPRPVDVARPVGGGGGLIATSFAPQ